MFFIHPDPFLLPSYRISPFKTDYITLNSNLPEDDFAAGYFDKKFGIGKWQYTYNGREAIELALEKYQLHSHALSCRLERKLLCIKNKLAEDVIDCYA